MKPIFRCEYCQFTGTEEEVLKHEDECFENYTKRSCWTCQYGGYKGWEEIECEVGQEIPPGKMMTFCPQYKRKEKQSYGDVSDLFKVMFGGLGK